MYKPHPQFGVWYTLLTPQMPVIVFSVEPSTEQRWPVSSGADFNPTPEKPKVGFAAR